MSVTRNEIILNGAIFILQKWLQNKAILKIYDTMYIKDVVYINQYFIYSYCFQIVKFDCVDEVTRVFKNKEINIHIIHVI